MITGEKIMKSLFEEMGGTYTLGEDGMYYPDLAVPDGEPARYGKYGRMRRAFLRQHRQGLYTRLLLTGKLITHLNEIDEEAIAKMELIVKQMAQRQHIDEALKGRDQMAWVRAMNNIRNAAEEIVFSELIYA
jgi:hypothetical protein